MTRVADHEVLHEALAKLTLGSPLAFKGLTVVPLLRFDAADPDWLTSDEAVAAGTLEVTEASEGGSVPALRVVNKGDRAVFLLDSEELVGAKQNRILNTSVLIAAGQTITIPVSCVEQGRWAYRSRAFASAKRSLYASVRRKKAAQVHESLRMKRGHTADQRQIWADLEAKAEAHGVESPTFAMSDVFESRVGDLEAYGRALKPELGQVGAIVYLGSEWWALELLAGPKLFRKAWERLLPGYAIEALLSSPGGSPKESPEKWLAAILQAPLETFPAVGVGEDHRFQAGEFMGAALVAEGQLAHLMAFPV
ncbi:MAG: DUF6569 family protein [Candidatus Rokuibacteriota bacterium]